LKTTWQLRLVVCAAVVLILWSITIYWIRSIGQELVCAEGASHADVILVENFDPNYHVFERAAELRKQGSAWRVFVPTYAATDPAQANVVYAGIVEVMVRVAQLPEPEIIPITVVEPVSLNAAFQIRKVLQQQHVRSVIVVAPGFRSRRSLLVYNTIFREVGITTSCVPVFGGVTPQTWTRTWHGIQDVAEQYVKLQYYRWYVLPRLHGRAASH
jgi:hypothetical protein